jgi:hypothetical protein
VARSGPSKADDSGVLGRFLRALGSSTRHNSLAYGYSLALTSSFGMLTLLDRSPHVADLFVFGIGAAATFTIANAVVTRGYRVKTQEEPPVVIAFGTSFGMVSVVGSIAVAALCGWLLKGWVGWLVGGFGASTAYLVLGAFELVGAYALRAFLGEHSLEER